MGRILKNKLSPLRVNKPNLHVLCIAADSTMAVGGFKYFTTTVVSITNNYYSKIVPLVLNCGGERAKYKHIVCDLIVITYMWQRLKYYNEGFFKEFTQERASN